MGGQWGPHYPLPPIFTQCIFLRSLRVQVEAQRGTCDVVRVPCEQDRVPAPPGAALLTPGPPRGLAPFLGALIPCVHVSPSSVPTHGGHPQGAHATPTARQPSFVMKAMCSPNSDIEWMGSSPPTNPTRVCVGAGGRGRMQPCPGAAAPGAQTASRGREGPRASAPGLPELPLPRALW